MDTNFPDEEEHLLIYDLTPTIVSLCVHVLASGFFVEFFSSAVSVSTHQSHLAGLLEKIDDL